MHKMPIASALAAALSIGFVLCSLALRPDVVKSYPTAITAAQAAPAQADPLRP